MSRADLYKNVQSEINALMKRIEELEAALSLAEKMDETKAGLITELEAENKRLKEYMCSQIESYFHNLRFDEAHHLGLGDVRVTKGQIDELLEVLRNSHAPSK